MLYEETVDGQSHAPGERIGLDLSEHKVLRSLISEPTDEPVFEKAENFPHDSGLDGVTGRTALKRGRVSLCMGDTRLCVFIAQRTYAPELCAADVICAICYCYVKSIKNML